MPPLLPWPPPPPSPWLSLFFFRYFFGSFSFLLRQSAAFAFAVLPPSPWLSLFLLPLLLLSLLFSASLTPPLLPWRPAAAFALAFAFLLPSLLRFLLFSASLTPPLLLLQLPPSPWLSLFLLPLLLLFLLFSASLTPPLLLLQCCRTSFCFFYSNIVFFGSAFSFLDLLPQAHLFPPRVSLQGVFSLLLLHA